MSYPKISHVRVLTVYVFYRAVCDRLKQSLISISRLTSKTKEKQKNRFYLKINYYSSSSSLSQDTIEVYTILHK
jgi:hypothetical protein